VSTCGGIPGSCEMESGRKRKPHLEDAPRAHDLSKGKRLVFRHLTVGSLILGQRTLDTISGNAHKGNAPSSTSKLPTPYSN